MATTIKVDEALRDRVNQAARARGVSAARLIDEMLQRHERWARLEAFAAAMATADDRYWDEFAEWDAAERHG